MASILLNATKTVAMVNGAELKVGDVIDYVSTIENKVRSGIIDKFHLVDPKDWKSIWASVRDLNGDGVDIISMVNWNSYLEEGVIKN